MKCKYCEREFEKLKSLTNHQRWHSLPKYHQFQLGYSEKMSKIQIGNKYNLGHKMSDNQKKNISIFNSGSNHGLWKGNAVGYGSLHQWIKTHKPKPQFCEECKIKEPYDLANISQNYQRDINDFEWLCRKCHMIKDGRFERLCSNA